MALKYRKKKYFSNVIEIFLLHYKFLQILQQVFLFENSQIYMKYLESFSKRRSCDFQ